MKYVDETRVSLKEKAMVYGLVVIPLVFLIGVAVVGLISGTFEAIAHDLEVIFG